MIILLCKHFYYIRRLYFKLCFSSFVNFSPNGACLIAGCLDNKIRIWNRLDSQCLQVFTGHLNLKYKIDTVVLLWKDTPYLLSGSEDGHLYVWNQDTGNLVVNQKLHDGNLYNLFLNVVFYAFSYI